jgi:prevent-host-death family protein
VRRLLRVGGAVLARPEGFGRAGTTGGQLMLAERSRTTVLCATLSHMETVGVRELRRQASAILRRVAAGETVEVTDRGRSVAVLLRTMPSGLARLEREGLLRRAEGDVLELAPVRLPPGSVEPSRLVAEGRAD